MDRMYTIWDSYQLFGNGVVQSRGREWSPQPIGHGLNGLNFGLGGSRAGPGAGPATGGSFGRAVSREPVGAAQGSTQGSGTQSSTIQGSTQGVQGPTQGTHAGQGNQSGGQVQTGGMVVDGAAGANIKNQNGQNQGIVVPGGQNQGVVPNVVTRGVKPFFSSIQIGRNLSASPMRSKWPEKPMSQQ